SALLTGSWFKAPVTYWALTLLFLQVAAEHGVQCVIPRAAGLFKTSQHLALPAGRGDSLFDATLNDLQQALDLWCAKGCLQQLLADEGQYLEGHFQQGNFWYPRPIPGGPDQVSVDAGFGGEKPGLLGVAKGKHS